MAKKSRKRLGQDIKVKDVLLLDRPEVEILEEIKPDKRFRKAPKGKIFKVREKKSKQEFEIYLSNDEKVDCTYRPNLWDKMKFWLDGTHKKYNEKHRNLLIPPLFR